MYRNTIIFLIFLMTFQIVGRAQEYHFIQPHDVKMKITIMDHFYNDSVKLNDTVSIGYYNHNGNEIRSIDLSDGMMSSEIYYHYDQANRLIEELYICRLVYGSDGEVDENGELITIAIQDSTVTLIQKYKYDHKGNLIQKDGYTYGEHMEISYRYKYDRQNRLIEETQVRYPVPICSVGFLPGSTEIDDDYKIIENVETSRDTYKYAGNLRICERFDSKGLYSVDTVFFINKLIQKKVTYDENRNKKIESRYSYNTKGLLIERRSSFSDDYGANSDLSPISKIEYEYDAGGILIKERRYDKKLIQEIHYKYIK